MSRKSTLSVARKGMLQTRPRLFGQSRKELSRKLASLTASLFIGIITIGAMMRYCLG